MLLTPNGYEQSVRSISAQEVTIRSSYTPDAEDPFTESDAKYLSNNEEACITKVGTLDITKEVISTEESNVRVLDDDDDDDDDGKRLADADECGIAASVNGVDDDDDDDDDGT